MKKIIAIIILFSLSVFADEEKAAIIIDVRTTNEYNAEHITRAIHIPYKKIGDEISTHTTSKQDKIILYCARGGRAGKALKTLEEMGYTNVENAGGIEDLKKRLTAQTQF